MHETRLLRADDLAQMGEKGDDIVLGDGLDLVDAGGVEFGVFGAPDGLGISFGDHAEGGLGVAGMGLDLVPDAEFGFGGPNFGHGGARISGDHGGPCIAVGDAVS